MKIHDHRISSVEQIQKKMKRQPRSRQTIIIDRYKISYK